MRRFVAAAALAGGALAPFVISPADAAGPHEIVIDASGFDPSSLTIPSGEAVYWCNDDDEVHSVVFEDDGPASGPLDPEECTEDLVFPTAGTYAYHDGDNTEATASITVTESPTTTTTLAAPSTTAAPSPTTTARPTATTRRPTVTTRRPSAATFRTTTTSTSIVETTTTTGFFDTTTLFTTTTFGSFAITELGSGDDGAGTLAGVLAGLGVLGGAGYLGYRYRWRLFR